jgi:hypothetical protein
LVHSDTHLVFYIHNSFQLKSLLCYFTFEYCPLHPPH